jgi:quinolinate synthase
MINNGTEINLKIEGLKRNRNAIILAHNYQRGEVQDIADFVGDSLELCQIAAKTEADVIVFCGVHFMAETASILCPDKIVLLPDINAGCPMANMVTAEKLREKKRELPDASVVCYINSSAEVKAESDICCTSANAVEVIKSLNSHRIIFIPDKYLGHFVSSKIIDKQIVLWPGFCPTHVKFIAEHVALRKKEYPHARVVVHPECRGDVIGMADLALSTGGMCKFAGETQTKDIIIGTETGIIHRLLKENPEKCFIPLFKYAICPNMKLTTLEKIHEALDTMSPQVTVHENVREGARRAVQAMLEHSQ